jgi:hypothetical protein
VNNWRKLTEHANYRVIYLPDNRTLSAEMIAGVRLVEADPPKPLLGLIGCARRVLIDVCGLDISGRRCLKGWGDPVYAEPDAVFAMLTEAHARAQAVGGTS